MSSQNKSKLDEIVQSIKNDLNDKYLVLDYQVVFGSLITSMIPLLASYLVERQKNSTFDMELGAVREIMRSVKNVPFELFRSLKKQSFSVIRGKIEDPSGDLRRSWIAEYVQQYAKNLNRVLGKPFIVSNPQNPGETIKVVFDNFKGFNPEITGYQMFEKNQLNPLARYISDYDTVQVFRNVVPNSKVFFNLDDVYISGMKLNSPDLGDYIRVTNVFTNVRERLSLNEIQGLNKTKKTLIFISAGLIIVALAFGIRILWKKDKRRKQQKINL